MSIKTEIERIEASRDTIRTKLVGMGLAGETDHIEALAEAIFGIVEQGAASIEITEGSSYTIPAGYHTGSGVVKAVSDEAGDAEKYRTQAKTITPTKAQQHVTADDGYYALESVTVEAIPSAYQNVSSVNALAEDVLTGKIYVTKDGTVTVGTMANNGTVERVLDATVISYTIPKGYHSGTGTVKINLDTKTVTPTKEVQDIVPTNGTVLSKVTVAPIPDQFKDVTGTDVTADDVLDGKIFANTSGKSTGAMPNNGTASKVLDTTNGNQSFAIQKGYHSGQGQVSIVLESKTATPDVAEQNIIPTTGKVLSKVIVEAIPTKYKDTTGTDVTATDVLAGKVFVNASGKDTGTMANNGAIDGAIDGLETMTYTIPAGYTSGGKVTLTDDIENRLKEI